MTSKKLRKRVSPRSSRKKSKSKPYCFVQSLDVYKAEVLVALNCTKEDLVRIIKKNKKSFTPNIVSLFEDVGEDGFKQVGCYILRTRDDGEQFHLILLEESDEWLFWEALLHETNHAVHGILKEGAGVNDWEAEAYAHEFLFREIRRKIQKVELHTRYYG